MSFKLLNIVACAAIAFVVTSLPVSAQTVLKVGHFATGSDAFSETVNAFSAEVEARSAGRLKVQVYPAGQLGNEKQQISALQGELQELLITTTTNLTNMSEPLRLLDLPFVFGSYADADAVTMSDTGAKLLSGLEEANLVGLALWDNGFRSFTNNKRPITTPDDMKGLAMRVISAPVFIDTFSALGAQPVPMPFPEVLICTES